MSTSKESTSLKRGAGLSGGIKGDRETRELGSGDPLKYFQISFTQIAPLHIPIHLGLINDSS
jgi:hypothetical protein